MPWAALGTILRQAPVILAGADALLSRTRQPTTTAADLEALRQRVADLEQHQQGTATLAKELAEQSTVLATAVHEAAARARQALILGGLAMALGVISLAVVLLRG